MRSSLQKINVGECSYVFRDLYLQASSVGANKTCGPPFVSSASMDWPTNVVFNELATAIVCVRFAFCSAVINPAKKVKFWANAAAGGEREKTKKYSLHDFREY